MEEQFTAGEKKEKWAVRSRRKKKEIDAGMHSRLAAGCLQWEVRRRLILEKSIGVGAKLGQLKLGKMSKWGDRGRKQEMPVKFFFFGSLQLTWQLPTQPWVVFFPRSGLSSLNLKHLFQSSLPLNLKPYVLDKNLCKTRIRTKQ
ncbi:hypothetical protein Adt_44365 [Abeliophyllum distichum]|uniref:Uncharacterized protein n=1 Tax=Abeliophyllum distichum TaxID=126358 RepID=A0ABD1PAQ9_9LAMI